MQELQICVVRLSEEFLQERYLRIHQQRDHGTNVKEVGCDKSLLFLLKLSHVTTHIGVCSSPLHLSNMQQEFCERTIFSGTPPSRTYKRTAISLPYMSSNIQIPHVSPTSQTRGAQQPWLGFVHQQDK